MYDTDEVVAGRCLGDHIPDDQVLGDQVLGDPISRDQVLGDPIPGDQVPGDLMPVVVTPVARAVRCAELVVTARVALSELAGLVSDGVFGEVPDVAVGEYVSELSRVVEDASAVLSLIHI